MDELEVGWNVDPAGDINTENFAFVAPGMPDTIQSLVDELLRLTCGLGYVICVVSPGTLLVTASTS